MFKRNEGILDRFVRVVLGLVLLPVGLFVLGGSHASAAGIITAAIGTIALVTGVTGVCPSYNLVGINTLEKEREFIAKCRTMMAGCIPGMNSSAGRMCWPGTRKTEETHTPQT